MSSFERFIRKYDLEHGDEPRFKEPCKCYSKSFVNWLYKQKKNDEKEISLLRSYISELWEKDLRRELKLHTETKEGPAC